MKITFVHGRPAPHPLHAMYGQRVAASSRVVDPWIRWHDRKTSAILTYVAWVVNSFYFAGFRRQVVLTEGLHMTLVLAKIMSFGRLKLICLAGDESPYFTVSGFYRGPSYFANRFAFRSYDGFVCIGEMVRGLVADITRSRVPLETSFNGVADSRMAALSRVNPNLESHVIVCIANGPDGWRSWYKGIDLLVKVVEELSHEFPALRVRVIGTWTTKAIESFKAGLAPEISGHIEFPGHSSNVENVLAGCGLCVHPGRGEAWGIGVTEAMAAGLPAFVSEWTGMKEVASSVSAELVMPLDIQKITQRIRWYLNLPVGEKRALSEQCRTAAAPYTASRAVDNFETSFKAVLNKVL
jgi:glycosyltransferase involved in cell wall biosynthesis